jgi:CRISPR-associated protein Csd1
MQCIVCGNDGPVLRTHPKIKGVPNSNAAGANIIAANADAFTSYGLEQSLIAPTCPVCADRFTRAANALLSGPATSLKVGDDAFIFWTREDVGFSLSSYFSDPQPGEVQALLRVAQEGREPADIDTTAFYAATLAGNNARIAVRDWIDTTVGAVKANLATWFRRQAIVNAYGEQPAPLKLVALAGATVRELKDLPAATPRALLNCALTGAPAPRALLAQAVRRTRADQNVDRAQAALIKLVLCGLDRSLEERMVQLDTDTTNPAYRCGRLLAVLEQIQREALPGVNATIVDRFFGTASSAPLSVFPRLVRGAQPHLSKLERDRRGAYVALQARMEDVLGGLPDFPRVLTLEEQGRFALGYYHQRAHDRAQAREAAERRRAGQTPDTTAKEENA